MNKDTDKINSEKLTDDIEEQKDFIKQGFERIKKYYTLSSDEREKETGLSISPHELILQSSISIIDLGSYSGIDYSKVCEKCHDYLEIEWLELGMQKIGFNYILIGIGTEILLKAIFLKENSEIFIKKTRFKEKQDVYFTPTFNECKKWLITHLKNKLPRIQLKRIKDVLELIQLKRNNLAHLNFHSMSGYREDYQVANVLIFLLLYFFEENLSETVVKLNQIKKETKVTSGIDYESVEFDEYI